MTLVHSVEHPDFQVKIQMRISLILVVIKSWISDCPHTDVPMAGDFRHSGMNTVFGETMPTSPSVMEFETLGQGPDLFFGGGNRQRPTFGALD